jgi:hypothetical protein
MEFDLEKELNDVRQRLVDIETPATRELLSKESIDNIRKSLTTRFKSLLVLKGKKVDKDTAINIQSQCNSTLDRPQLITIFYKENQSSSPDQEEQESLS